MTKGEQVYSTQVLHGVDQLALAEMEGRSEEPVLSVEPKFTTSPLSEIQASSGVWATIGLMHKICPAMANMACRKQVPDTSDGRRSVPAGFRRLPWSF